MSSWWRRLVAAALATIASTAGVLIVQPAPVGATVPCGFHLGSIFVNRGAGSGAFEVPLLPNSAAQRCSTTVPAQANILLPGGGRPSNVSGNPSSGSVTVSFSPFEVVPRVSWEWRPFCSDPAAVAFTATIAGASASISTVANSCRDFGGSSLLQAPAVLPAQPAFLGLAATPSGAGIWGAGAGGQVTSAGDATNFGGPTVLAAPVAGMAATPDGQGYWLVAGDGGVFSFGDAGFFGSAGSVPLRAPVAGMAATPDGRGYWLVAGDGGVFSFGDATFAGSAGSVPLSAPVTGMAATPTGRGYWLLVQDGNVVALGDALALAPQ